MVKKETSKPADENASAGTKEREHFFALALPQHIKTPRDLIDELRATVAIAEPSAVFINQQLKERYERGQISMADVTYVRKITERAAEEAANDLAFCLKHAGKYATAQELFNAARREAVKKRKYF